MIMGFENGNDSTGTIPTHLMGGVDADGNVRAIAVLPDGKIQTSGGGDGGAGDASATNQNTQITRETEIRDRLPSALVSDRLKVDGSGVTQPVSLDSVPLATNAATETTLQQVRDAIKAQIDIASTIWTDNSGVFYVRRDLVNEGTGAITVAFTDPTGSTATPVAGLRPLATTDKDTITGFYDVTTSATGYSIGDLLVRVAILDANSGLPSVTFIWLNLTAGTILGAAPNSTNIERADETIGTRQVGTWSFSLPANAATETTLAAINTSLAKGQAVMASSLPVTIASNQSSISVVIQDGLVVNASISTTGNLFIQDTTGYQSVLIQVTSAGTGCTITYEASNDGTIYLPVLGYDLGTSTVATPVATTTTAVSRVFPCYGKFFRARVTFGSGTVSVSANFRTFPFIGSTVVTQATNANLNTNSTVAGNNSHGNTVTALPVSIHYEARTSQRTPVSDGTVSRPITDKLGRTIAKIGQIRELQQNDFLALSNTTETTLIGAGGASIFNDITDLIISNTSLTGVRLDIRDSTAGTIRLSIWIPANSTPPPMSFAGILKQSTANNAWTAQLSAAVTDVRITAISEKAA